MRPSHSSIESKIATTGGFGSDDAIGLQMTQNDYVFITRWRMAARCEEIADIFEDTAALSRWWPTVFLRADIVEPGAGHGLGRVVDVASKGFLPYTTRWRFTVIAEAYPYSSRIRAQGQFVGSGAWTFERDGDFTNVTYDWRVRTEDPLMRRWSAILRPIFIANHHWAMAQGRKGLQRELARRQTLANP